MKVLGNVAFSTAVNYRSGQFQIQKITFNGPNRTLVPCVRLIRIHFTGFLIQDPFVVGVIIIDGLVKDAIAIAGFEVQRSL